MTTKKTDGKGDMNNFYSHVFCMTIRFRARNVRTLIYMQYLMGLRVFKIVDIIFLPIVFFFGIDDDTV